MRIMPPAIALLLVAAVSYAAGRGERTEGAAAGGVPLDTQVSATVDNLAIGYRQAAGIWSGFDPRDHPTVVAFRSDGAIAALLAVNHAGAGSLGQATALDTAGTPFRSLHRIAAARSVTRRLDRVEHFEFRVPLGDVDSFVMIADPSRGLDPAGADWTATYLHEMFHRYQEFAFYGPPYDQNVEGYAFTPRNLELAVLEGRALAEAVTSDSADHRRTAARRFAALRLARLQADPRVALDNGQELFEGTARYLEHRLAGEDRRYSYHGRNYHVDLITEFPGEGIKEAFGFGRFYASGAAVLRILDLTGATEVDRRVQAGRSPAEVLIEHLGVTQAEVAALVAAARAAYDPQNSLAGEARQAARRAAREGPVFDGDDGSPGDDGGSEEAIDLTKEQAACIDEALGESEDGQDQDIPDEVWERCVGA